MCLCVCMCALAEEEVRAMLWSDWCWGLHAVNRSVDTFTGRSFVYTAVTCNVLVPESRERLCKTKRAELYRESSSFPARGGGGGGRWSLPQSPRRNESWHSVESSCLCQTLACWCSNHHPWHFLGSCLLHLWLWTLQRKQRFRSMSRNNIPVQYSD